MECSIRFDSTGALQVIITHPPVISYSPADRIQPFVHDLRSLGIQVTAPQQPCTRSVLESFTSTPCALRACVRMLQQLTCVPVPFLRISVQTPSLQRAHLQQGCGFTWWWARPMRVPLR